MLISSLALSVVNPGVVSEVQKKNPFFLKLAEEGHVRFSYF